MQIKFAKTKLKAEQIQQTQKLNTALSAKKAEEHIKKIDAKIKDERKVLRVRLMSKQLEAEKNIQQIRDIQAAKLIAVVKLKAKLQRQKLQAINRIAIRKLKIAENGKRIAQVKNAKIRATAIAKEEMEAKELKRKITKANAKT